MAATLAAMTPAELMAMLRQAQGPLEESMNTLNSTVGRIDGRLESLDSKVQDVDSRLRETEERLKGLDAELEEKIMRALAARPAPPSPAPSTATSTTGRSTATTTASRSLDDVWRPQAIIVRGWSPHGAPPTSRISRSAAVALADKLLAAVPDRERRSLLLYPPFQANYQLKFRVVGDLSVWELRDRLAAAADDGDTLVGGQPIKVTVEISPERRRQFGRYFDAVRCLERADGTGDAGEGSAWQKDVRQCQVLSMDLDLIGGMDKHGSEFVWNPEKLLAAGYKLSPDGTISKRKRRADDGGKRDDEGEATDFAGEKAVPEDMDL